MKKDIQKVAMTSENIENDNLQKLRAVFPQFVKDGSIDFDTLQAFFKKEGILAGVEKYGLNWAGKSKAFGDINRTATGTLTPQLDESKNWDNTENIFIEGENLEVLKLLQKKYANPGKIKICYLDPPYNTGKDFIYKDNFTQNVSDYYEQTAQTKDGIKLTSNPESNGRYHSDWLTMMYSRLFLARNLLKDDGVIFVSIDDNEVGNLRMIMDEIFGEENFIGQLIHQRAKGGGQAKYIVKGHDYILVYAKVLSDKFSLKKEKVIQQKIIEKNGIQYLKNDDVVRKKFGKYDKSLGDRRCFYEELEKYKGKKKKQEIDEKLKNKELFLEKTENGMHVIFELTPIDEASSKLYSIIKVLSEEGKKDLEDLGIGVFDYPKPVQLIKLLVEAGAFESNNNDIVLDYFAGSGTTAQAVMQLNAEEENTGNRKYICVQIPQGLDEADGKTVEAKKAIKEAIALLESIGKPTNIAEICKERIRRAGAKIGKGDIGFKAFSLSSSNYRRWNTLTQEDDEKTLIKQVRLFLEKPLIDGYDKKSVIYEILEKEGFDLNSKIKTIKKDGITYYQVVDSDKEMAITFANKLTKEKIEGLELPKDTTFVCFDNALDDTTKVNLMRNLAVKTI